MTIDVASHVYYLTGYSIIVGVAAIVGLILAAVAFKARDRIGFGQTKHTEVKTKVKIRGQAKGLNIPAKKKWWQR
jgi:uncharacterized membrane protein